MCVCVCVHILHTQEDYLHLVKLLTTHVCKSVRLSKTTSAAKWTVGEGTRSNARDLVQKVMSQSAVYSADSNLQLDLTEC